MAEYRESTDHREVDFRVIREDYCRYQLVDGTLLRVKICVLKIRESLERGPGGYPEFSFKVSNVLTCLVPDRLKSAPSSQVADNDVVEEMEFKVQDDEWQEYELLNGFLLRIKPVVTKIFKHKGYNAFGEPIYSVPLIQHIQDVGYVGTKGLPAGKI